MHLHMLTTDDIDAHLLRLMALLIENVADGASIGFHAPLADADAERYWRGVQDGLRQGSRVLIVAGETGGALVGAGQLSLDSRPNARHRAEVQKLMVAPKARRRGIARALMEALEQAARDDGRTLLLLDTREGDPAETLYRSLGWTLVGRVPGYVLERDGTTSATMIYYRTLAPR